MNVLLPFTGQRFANVSFTLQLRRWRHLTPSKRLWEPVYAVSHPLNTMHSIGPLRGPQIQCPLPCPHEPPLVPILSQKNPTQILTTSFFESHFIVKIIIFWDVMRCSVLEVNRRFGATYFLQCQDRRGNRASKQKPKQRRNRQASTRLHGVTLGKIEPL
jgi:hypothetical protein